MGNTELCLREGPQAWEECLLVLEQTWEGDARTAEEVLQVTLRNDQSCLSQCRIPRDASCPMHCHSQRPPKPCASYPHTLTAAPTLKPSVPLSPEMWAYPPLTSRFWADASKGYARSNNKEVHRFFILCLSLGPSGMSCRQNLRKKKAGDTELSTPTANLKARIGGVVGTLPGTYAIGGCGLTVRTNRLPDARAFGSVTWATSVEGRNVGLRLQEIAQGLRIPISLVALCISVCLWVPNRSLMRVCSFQRERA